MIPVILFEDIKTPLEHRIVQFVNKNLKVFIEVYIDYLNSEDERYIPEKLMEVLPREYVLRAPKECRNLIDELYEIVKSPVERSYIKPKYEYILYHIIYTWKEICDDEDEYIPIKLSEDLRNDISECEDFISEDGANTILNSIEDIDQYLYFCFYDHDFLPMNLEETVSLYLKSPTMVSVIFPDVDLEDYKDLMPVDLRELYIERREEYTRLNVIEEVESIEECIVKEFYSAFQLIQNHTSEFEDKSEVEISNEIFRMTKRLFKEKFELEIEREAEVGRANKKLGETDFLIYKNNKEYRNIAIVENKYIDKFLNAYGQLLGYLNDGFKFGVTISINKDRTLDEAFKFVINKLNCIDDEQFKVVNVEISPFGDEYKYIAYSEHILPEDKSRTMKLYHLIINLNDSTRQKVAKKARPRKKSM